jgi:hypothetical protein
MIGEESSANGNEWMLYPGEMLLLLPEIAVLSLPAYSSIDPLDGVDAPMYP